MSKGKYFYSKGEGNDGYIKNLEVLFSTQKVRGTTAT